MSLGKLKGILAKKVQEHGSLVLTTGGLLELLLAALRTEPENSETFPKCKYHVSQAPRMVASPEEEKELGPEWRDEPYPRFEDGFPKTLVRLVPFTCQQEKATASTPDEEKKLIGEGWSPMYAPVTPSVRQWDSDEQANARRRGFPVVKIQHGSEIEVPNVK